MRRVESLTLVVPVYNEEENLEILLDQMEQALAPTGRAYDYLFVDDGSTDGSLAILRRLAAGSPRVHYLAFAQNRGQSAAFGAGFAAAPGQVLATLDADLQNDPADIPAMLDRMEAEDADMVIGWRHQRQDTRWKKFGSRLGNWVRNALTHETVHDTGCSLKLLRADLARKLPMFHGMHRFLPTLMKMQGAKVVEVKVNHRPRLYGTSKYGNLRRAVEGFRDLLAVRWMQQRSRPYSIKEQA
jgi:dolichol-phosphate mannosyltransferase